MIQNCAQKPFIADCLGCAQVAAVTALKTTFEAMLYATSGTTLQAIGKANREFFDVCSLLYRNPKAAWSEIDRRLKTGGRFEDIDLETVGKKTRCEHRPATLRT